MGPGGIATIIAASSLAVIAVAISYTVIRASRLIDEVTTTLSYINKAAQSVEDLATKVTGATDSFLDENPLAMKAAGVIVAAAKLKKGKKRKVAK
jgi:uncharacterized protein YoxC